MVNLTTELNDRILRFDGVSIVHPEQLERLLLLGVKPSQVRIIDPDEITVKFNTYAGEGEDLKPAIQEPVSFDFTWKVPAEFLALDINEYVSAVFCERLPGLAYEPTRTEEAINRVALELAEFKTRGLEDVLRTIIFVLHRLRETNQIYGVGRGSSCASYILFLLGLHTVDAVKFNVSMEEFFHD